MKMNMNILKQPSTWRGIVWLMAAVGLQISPEQQTAIITAGATVVGLIGTLTSDKAEDE